MRRAIIGLAILTLSLLWLIPAAAVPGIDDPEDVPEAFTLTADQPGTGLMFGFDVTSGVFDPGDRQGYDCAFIELLSADHTAVDAVVAFERVGGLTQENGEPYVRINDRGMAEVSDGHEPGPGAVNTGDLCGEVGPPIVDRQGNVIGFGKGDATWDGTDHFPHVIHDGDRLAFYRDGVLVGAVPVAAGQCDRGYLVPGDEPGELWLWWDEDGPTSSHSEGGNDLPCGGGPLEPIAIARLYVDYAGPSIGYCTETMHETSCGGFFPPPPTTTTPTPTCTVNPKTGQCRPPKT